MVVKVVDILYLTWLISPSASCLTESPHTDLELWETFGNTPSSKPSTGKPWKGERLNPLSSPKWYAPCLSWDTVLKAVGCYLSLYHDSNLCFPSMAESPERLQQLWSGIPEWEAAPVSKRQELYRLHGSVCVFRILLHKPQDGAPFRKLRGCSSSLKTRLQCYLWSSELMICHQYLCDTISNVVLSLGT